MKKFAVFLLIFTGCSVSEYKTALYKTDRLDKLPVEIYRQKRDYYLKNPRVFVKDAKIFISKFDAEINRFLKALSIWKTAKKPQAKTLVKYTDAYKARAIVNFDKGTVRVETIRKDYKNALQKALVNTMLMPQDPRAVDLFSDKIVLKGKPFLAGEVYDFEQKPVLYQWRANRYAKWLIKKKLTSYNSKGQKVYFVTFGLSKNAEDVRVRKYIRYVNENAKRFKISKPLILAVIKTESDFNQYAVSYVPAFGLMQIVPTTAGVEGFERAYGYGHIPSKEFLFDAKNNITIAVRI